MPQKWTQGSLFGNFKFNDTKSKTPKRDGPTQWRSGSALQTGRREIILDRACQPSRSEYFVVFSETRVNTG